MVGEGKVCDSSNNKTGITATYIQCWGIDLLIIEAIATQ